MRNTNFAAFLQHFYQNLLTFVALFPDSCRRNTEDLTHFLTLLFVVVNASDVVMFVGS